MGLLRSLKKSAKPHWRRRPEILRHPCIPAALFGLAPRVVLGKKWWDETRRAAYRSTDYHCLACGRGRNVVGHLEAHECYEMNYIAGRMTYQETVPLCEDCHRFIHQGHLSLLLHEGKITREEAMAVLNHGKKVLAEAGLKPIREYTGPIAHSAAWRLVVFGKEYSAHDYRGSDRGKNLPVHRGLAPRMLRAPVPDTQVRPARAHLPKQRPRRGAKRTR